jgi:phosphoribosylglycinamide formyltransferase-1
MTKKLKLNINNNTIEKAIIKYFRDKDVKVVNEGLADLTVTFCGNDIATDENIINIHPSLLPAFATKEAIKDSFLYGVKVSGISIHYIEKGNFYGRIIAQYPILIGNNTHFDEYENEIIKLCAKISPQIIETVLNDKVFDFSQLYQTSPCQKQGGCTSCHGCHN